MGRATTIPDQFAQLADIEERLRRLEQLLPEDPHIVGATGEPGFMNSWVNYDVSRKISFYRHGGRTYLFGVAKSGASGTSIFTLPVGYRPLVGSSDLPLVLAGSGSAFITPMDNGQVLASNLTGSVNTFVELNGLSFRHT